MKRFFIYTTHGSKFQISLDFLVSDFDNNSLMGELNNTIVFMISLSDVMYVKEVIGGVFRMVNFEDIKEV